MLSEGELETAFAVYWREMEHCRASRTYWALLHVTVCIPDICAALESDNGEATGPRYAAWCERYLPDPLLSGAERWRMRCKILHQGRAATEQPGRHLGFSFAQPSATGRVDHRRLDGATLVVDVGELSKETQSGAGRWISAIAAAPGSETTLNVERNLGSLVQVRSHLLPNNLLDILSVVPIISRTS